MITLTQAQTNVLKALAESQCGITVIAASLMEADGFMVRAAIVESEAEHAALVAFGFLQDVTSEFKDAIERMSATLGAEHLRGRKFKVYTLTETGRALFTDFKNFVN